MEGTPSASTLTPANAAASAPTSKSGQHAGFWIRVGAIAIDALLLILLSLAVMLVSTLMGVNSETAYEIGGALYFVILFVNFINLVVLQTIWGGSIGKRILKLKIVQKDGSKLSIGKGLLRELIGKPISLLALSIGFWMVAFHPEKKGLHDLISGTMVMKETA